MSDRLGAGISRQDAEGDIMMLFSCTQSTVRDR
jgi:hypothetical protein